MKGFLKHLFGGGNNETIHAYGITDTGRRRENNEDYLLIRPERRIFIVADGMGGHNAGEVASAEAVRAVDEFFTPEIITRMDSDPSSIGPLMIDAFHHANRHVNELANQSPEYKGMGCALIMAFMTGDTLHTCHVGDVRCYLVGPSGIRQLTNDHTEIARMVREGTMTPEEARTSKLRSYLTQAVGQTAAMEPELHTYRLDRGDRVLLCSDGLWDMLPDRRIQEIVSGTTGIDNVCTNLIAEANDAGGRDNVTVVVFEK
jgi:protein phosphatase